MKKLTAGIFTVLMGLVTVNAAEAAVASKGYVDEVAKAAAADVTALEATVEANKTEAAAATKQVADDLAEYETANDQAVSGLEERLQEVEKFSGEGEGSVAKQIADALSTANGYTDAEVKELADGAVKKNADDIAAMDTAYKTADTTLQDNIDALSGTVTAMDGAYKAADATTLESAKSYADGLATNYDAAGSADDALTAAKAYADQEDAKIESTIGNVAEGKTVVGMIAEAQQAATFDPTEIKADIKANADAIDAIEASEYATSGITAEKVSAYDAYDAKITANTSAAAAAQATANAAIPAPTGECQDATNKCVLTFNNTEYAWEVIERATDTTLE